MSPAGWPFNRLGLAIKILTALYVLELILNRVLIRTLIFIPYGPVLAVVAAATNYGGLFALNSTLILSVLVLAVRLLEFGLVGLLSALLLAIIALADYLGVVKLYWVLLGLALALIALDRRRILESLALIALLASSLTPSAPAHYASQILWLAAPLPHLSRRRFKALTWSAPLAALSTVFILISPYYMGQILIFGMGLISPWLLPIGIILYSLAERFWGLYALLLTGPRLQLSSQVFVLAALYLSDFRPLRRGGKG